MKRTLSALLTLALVVGLILPVVAQAAATRQLYFGSLKSAYTLKPGKTISERAHIYSKVMDNNWRSHAAKIKYQKWNGSKWKTISTIRPSRWGWFNFKASSTGSYRLYYQGCKHFKTKIFKFKVNKPVAPPVIKPPVVPPVVPVVPDPPVVPPVVKVDPQITLTANIDGTNLYPKATSPLADSKFAGASIEMKLQKTEDGNTWSDIHGYVIRSMDAASGGGSEAVVSPDIEIGPGDRYAKQFRAVATWPGNALTNAVALIESAPIDNPYYEPMVDPGFRITIPRITGTGISAVNSDNWIVAYINVTHTAATSKLSGGRLDLEYQGYNPSTSTWTTIGSREMSGIYAMEDLEKDLYAADAASKRFTKLRIKGSWGGSTYTEPYAFYSGEVNIPWMLPE